MLTSNPPAAPHTHCPKPDFRRKPLQPKNIILPISFQVTNDPKKCQNKTPISIFPLDYDQSNKENVGIFPSPIESIDASLAEELNAVRERMERLRLDKEKTDKLLEERAKILDFHLYELEERGEFQKELEIEVDRLFRLKELKLASMRMSPIQSLRVKETEKKCHEGHFENAKTEESKVELVDGRSTTESSSLSLESTSALTSSSSSASITKSTASSKMSLVLTRFSLASESNKK